MFPLPMSLVLFSLRPLYSSRLLATTVVRNCVVGILLSLAGIVTGCEAQTRTDSQMVKNDSEKQVDGTIQSDATALLDPVMSHALVASLVATNTQLRPGTDLKLIFSLKNLSDATVTVLPWGTPLEAVLSADIFDVAYKDEILPYRGRMVKRGPPVESDYLELPSGATTQSTVNLSQAYDTRTAGTYKVRLKTVEGLLRLYDQNARIETVPLVIERQ